MNVKKPKSRTISMADGTTMDVEISDTVCEMIKKEYSVDDVNESHIEAFFEDVLRDAVRKAIR
jgi:hypothetical protein